jgi:sterol desaturase/sphingolipid hydroxylase (fatty acid hydroxylase superfamily)
LANSGSGSLSIDWLLTHLTQLHSFLFMAGFAAVALWEHAAPRFSSRMPGRARWFNNLALMLAGSALTGLLLPIAAMSAAALALQHRWGLLNLIDLPSPLSCAIAIAVMDASAYWVHRLDHAVPLLWRLHQVHHADLEVDCTTSFLAHPLALLWEQSMVLATILLIGAPPLAVAVSLLLHAMLIVFNHGNVRLAPWPEQLLRWFIVTPDMHRVHHSAKLQESQRNLSSLFPWWDHLFGTYQAQPGAGHANMAMGLEEIRDPRLLTLWKMLALPLRRAPLVASA